MCIFVDILHALHWRVLTSKEGMHVMKSLYDWPSMSKVNNSVQVSMVAHRDMSFLHGEILPNRQYGRHISPHWDYFPYANILHTHPNLSEENNRCGSWNMLNRYDAINHCRCNKCTFTATPIWKLIITLIEFSAYQRYSSKQLSMDR